MFPAYRLLADSIAVEIADVEMPYCRKHEAVRSCRHWIAGPLSRLTYPPATVSRSWSPLPTPVGALADGNCVHYCGGTAFDTDNCGILFAT